MPGRSVYASILNDQGKFVDDCIIYHIAVNSWLVVHGTGAGMEQLTTVAAAKNCSVLFDDELHDMCLQVPEAVNILAKEVPAIRELDYFGLLQIRLYGRDVMISRTGCTGERGFEIFCRAKDAIHIWDSVLETGQLVFLCFTGPQTCADRRGHWHHAVPRSNQPIACWTFNRVRLLADCIGQ